MKTIEVKVNGVVIHSEELYGECIAGRLQTVKAWARRKAAGMPYEVYIKLFDKK